MSEATKRQLLAEIDRLNRALAASRETVESAMHCLIRFANSFEERLSKLEEAWQMHVEEGGQEPARGAEGTDG